MTGRDRLGHKSSFLASMIWRPWAFCLPNKQINNINQWETAWQWVRFLHPKLLCKEHPYRLVTYYTPTVRMLERGNGLLLWVSLSPKKRINMEVLPFKTRLSWWDWHDGSLNLLISMKMTRIFCYWTFPHKISTQSVMAVTDSAFPYSHQSTKSGAYLLEKRYSMFSSESQRLFRGVFTCELWVNCCCSFSNKTQQETLPFSCFRATAHALCGLGEGAPCMPEAAQTTPIH